MAKKQKTMYTQVEKIVMFAGIALIVMGCIANLYSIYINQRFIYDPVFNPIYYLKYLFLLAGSFVAGYFLTKGSNNSKKHDRLLNGVGYAFLAFMLYLLLDIIRLFIRNIFGTLPYPWEKIMFEGAPLVVLIITILIAYILQYRPKQSDFSMVAKWIFIVAFLAYQVYYPGTELYTLITSHASNDSYVTPFWFVVGSNLTNPLLIALITYLLLSNVKDTFQRLFYSAFVGSFSSIFMLVIWEFQTNPSLEATNIFEAIVIVLTLFITGLLLWRMHIATRRVQT